MPETVEAISLVNSHRNGRYGACAKMTERERLGSAIRPRGSLGGGDGGRRTWYPSPTRGLFALVAHLRGYAIAGYSRISIESLISDCPDVIPANCVKLSAIRYTHAMIEETRNAKAPAASDATPENK
jgi:hypothetical protein